MSIKGIIFDFDGTLFDSMSIWETAGTDYLATLGKTAEQDLSKKLKAMSLLQSAEYMKGHYSLPMTTDEIVNGINKTVEDFYFYLASPKDNVIPYLTRLKNNGTKMCIATATERYQVQAALKRCNMLKFFDEIFTCSEVGYGKDKAYIFDYALKSMEICKNEAAVFEDAYHAAKTAKNAGYFVIGIFDRYEKQADELKAISDIYYMDFAEALERGEL